MEYRLSILRQERGSNIHYWEVFNYSTDNEYETVVSALRKINSNDVIRNANGEVSRKIEFNSSCNQKKCGACSMVINDKPMLGCDARLVNLGDFIKIEPLRKFQTVCDLVVNRDILFENLKALKVWLLDTPSIPDKRRWLNYDSSECLQCGLCLEVCPNFYEGGKFFGMSSIVLMTRLISLTDIEARKEISKMYIKHGFSGCGKSLACKSVCPKGIETDRLLVNANLLTLWRKK